MTPFPSTRLRRRTLLQGTAAGAIGLAGIARAQDARTVRLVVPFPAGGATDAITRLAAETMAKELQMPCVVDNRAGAAGNIAADYVARAPQDGHTLLVAGQALMFINKALYKKLSFDPDTDFTPIGIMGNFPNVIVSNPEAVPAQNLKEFLDFARARPGGVSYGSNGIGSLSHLTTEVLASAANVKFLHVPYQGAAPQMTDLLSGRIGFSIIASQTVMPMIQQKKLRALAVTTRSRFADLPDVPSLVEAGFPQLDAPVWFAIMAPSQTPPPMLARLRSAFDAAVQGAAYDAGLKKMSALPARQSLQATIDQFAREKQLWVEAVRMTGATAT